mmetsp:Transcript_74953/g.243562  ORF Transcript_74953/g.243562 Transcript_74953/m.243562 type:complete len:211 (+) Transcript_74953:127-759(+)
MVNTFPSQFTNACHTSNIHAGAPASSRLYSRPCLRETCRCDALVQGPPTKTERRGHIARGGPEGTQPVRRPHPADANNNGGGQTVRSKLKEERYVRADALPVVPPPLPPRASHAASAPTPTRLKLLCNVTFVPQDMLPPTVLAAVESSDSTEHCDAGEPWCFSCRAETCTSASVMAAKTFAGRTSKRPQRFAPLRQLRRQALLSSGKAWG